MGGIVEAAAAYLAGEGGQVVRNALRRNGLPKDLFEDVTQEVLLRTHRAERRGDAIDKVEAFTNTLIDRTAKDMIRGHLRRPEGHLVPTSFEVDVSPIDERDLESVVVARQLLAELRGLLARALDESPHQAAGALAVLTISIDGAAPADDVPAPKGGVDADEAVAWAGLFYAGLRDCFPSDGQPEDNAMRKRRSRALRRQMQLLSSLARTLDALTDGSDG